MSPGGGQRRLESGDPLRGLAVLGVVVLHVATGAVFVTGHLLGAGGTLRPEEAFTPVGEWILRALPVSVYLFFALSGFLIARPFVEALVLGRPRPAIGSYLRNRALRLFPAAWLLIAVVYLRHGTRGGDAGEVLSTLTLTESYDVHPLESLIGQLWSLKVELSFYLLVPIAFVGIWRAAARLPAATARRRAVFGLAGLGAAASLVFSELAAGSVDAQRSLPWVLIAFMSGLALSAALAGRERLPERPPSRVLAAAVFGGGVLVALVAGRVGSSSPALTNLLATVSVTALLWAPVWLEANGGGTWRWLTNPALRWIGSRSYAIYLWHVVLMSELYPLVGGIEGYRVAMLALLPLVLAASAVLAELSWRLVELPALRLRAGRRSRDGRTPLAPEPVGAVAPAGVRSP